MAGNGSHLGKSMKHLFLLALVLFSAGCASVPMGDPSVDLKLKEFEVTPEKAGIYVYRNETFGATARMEVLVNGESIGRTAAKTYLFAEVEPGTYTITSKAENTSTLDVAVAPGTLAYVWQEVKMGILSARSDLQQVSEEVGRKGVRESKLAAGDR